MRFEPRGEGLRLSKGRTGPTRKTDVLPSPSHAPLKPKARSTESMEQNTSLLDLFRVYRAPFLLHRLHIFGQLQETKDNRQHQGRRRWSLLIREGVGGLGSSSNVPHQTCGFVEWRSPRSAAPLWCPRCESCPGEWNSSSTAWALVCPHKTTKQNNRVRFIFGVTSKMFGQRPLCRTMTLITLSFPRGITA